MVSFDDKHIFLDGKIYDVEKNITFDEKGLGPLFWLNFIKENSVFSALNNRMDNLSLNKMLRGILYEVSDRINTTKQYDLMCEFEKKFGSGLILEMNNAENFAHKLSQSWDFIINKIEYYGLVREANDASTFNNWVQTKGKNFIEGLREKMMSVVGMGVQTFLSFTGWGSLAVSTAYGALLAYDTYMAINGNTNWFNIIFDIIGLIPGVSRIASKAFKSAPAAAKSASSVEGVLTEVAKTKLGAQLVKGLGKVSSVASPIVKRLGEGVAWIAKKFGSTYLYNVISKLTSFVTGVITKIKNAATKFAQQNAVLSKKWGSAQNVGHALAKSGKDIGYGYGFTKGLDWLGKKFGG